MELTDRFEVDAAPDTVWTFLWDLPKVAMCLPGCEKIEAVDDSNYKAVMTQRVGPFKVSMDIDLHVDEINEGKNVLLSGSGKDRIGNRLKLSKLQMALDGSGSGTAVSYEIDFTLFGKLATLGSSVIKRKAEDVRAEFTQRLAQELTN